MRTLSLMIAIAAASALFASAALAQPPGPGKGGRAKGGTQASANDLVDRLMAFDKNKDGKLTKEEVTDPRLQRLFEKADANKDGIVTREELVALATELSANEGPGGQGGRGGFGGGPGGPGGPGGRPGGFGPPQPGQVLPPFLQEMLRLTDDQKKQLQELQTEVDAKLGKILTEEQKAHLKTMRERGPGGRRPGGEGPPNGGRPRPTENP